MITDDDLCIRMQSRKSVFTVLNYEHELTLLTIYLVVGSQAGVEAKLALIYNVILPKSAKQNFPRSH